jgi:short-subunit dehydrogenase
MDAAVRHLLPAMRDRGGGSVLAISSLAALRGVPYEAYYAASKAAAARYLDCLAHEVNPDKIHVSYLCPGYVATGFFERGGWYAMARPAVRGSGVTPDDVARAALERLRGHRRRAVVGWRENTIVLIDRLAPGLYDQVLRWRRRP